MPKSIQAIRFINKINHKQSLIVADFSHSQIILNQTNKIHHK